MNIKRRQFLTLTSAAILTAGVLAQSPIRRAFAQEQTPQTRLVMPPLLDKRATWRPALTAPSGSTAFAGGPGMPTARFNQAYLGPTIKVQNGEPAAEVQNILDDPIRTHWHGLLAPGEHDRGPYLPVAPGATWQPEMTIAQDPATVWHHSHIHEGTAVVVVADRCGRLCSEDKLQLHIFQ
jgi:FtsP/CotA-like multicopper oxidase with cupredoxin domain